MNERIRELAEQADGVVINKMMTGARQYTFLEEDLKKFAELIVLECAKAIADDDLAKDCYTFLMDSYAKGMRYSVEVIKEHFGIE